MLPFLLHCFSCTIGLAFVVIIALLLLFFSHCSNYVSLVSMVLPLPLPYVGQSLKLHHELSNTKVEFLSTFPIFFEFFKVYVLSFFSIHFVLFLSIMYQFFNFFIFSDFLNLHVYIFIFILFFKFFFQPKHPIRFALYNPSNFC